MAGELAFTRKHYSRLRQYWHAGRNGLTSAGDGIALNLTAAGHMVPKDTDGSLAMRITDRGTEKLRADGVPGFRLGAK